MEAAQWRRVKQLFDTAVDRRPPERARYLDTACGPDAALRREVESLLAAHDAAGCFLETPALESQARELIDALPDPNIGRRIGAYRIVKEIARGGMGDVYEAVRDDDEYSQRVAVKLLRFGFDSDFLRQRFRTERQILASLEHPNIAHLLDGGTTAEGQPYLVMELIDGLPLRRFCDQHRLTVAGKIELFRQVCFAVHAAHQRLIVHRDLKPDNILVTADARPMLLEFGIARALAPDAPAPREAATALLLTPAYASPEQVRGEIAGTASDVYSLGLILYELLAGERPYTTSGQAPHEVARTICESEPARPSAAARRSGNRKLACALAGDLDNIILKALRKEPERRYASAERLAEDLGRHLRHMPVSARPDTTAYRARKFLRRHRGPVAAAALIALLLVAGLAATLWQARRAEAERARAERRFEDVKALAAAMMYGIHDAIRDLPGSTHARQLLVGSALRYLDRLSRESRGDAALQRELAAAYERVGDVQGNPVLASLGDTRGAELS